MIIGGIFLILLVFLENRYEILADESLRIPERRRNLYCPNCERSSDQWELDRVVMKISESFATVMCPELGLVGHRVDLLTNRGLYFFQF